MRDEVEEGLGNLPSDLSEWAVVEHLLPPGWQEAARTCRAMKSKGGSITSALMLLRVLLIHWNRIAEELSERSRRRLYQRDTLADLFS